MSSIVRGKMVPVPKYFKNLQGFFEFKTENVSSCFNFNIVEEKFLQLSLEMKGFTFLLNEEEIDYSEIYQSISSSSENIEKFTKESNLMIKVINQTYQSFHEKYVNIEKTASIFDVLHKKIQIFEEKTLKLTPIPRFEHCVEDFTDCELIEESYQIINDFKTFGIDIQFDKKTIQELCYPPDFNFASQTIIDEKNRKIFQTSFTQTYKERKKHIPRLKKLCEIFQSSLKLIQHTDEEWSFFMDESLQFFTGIYQNMLNNLSFLPPINFDPSQEILKLSEYPSYLKKRILLISISITETLKSHKIIHQYDTLKKEKEKSDEENKQMKKLLKVLMLRGALEKAIFQIKFQSEAEIFKKIQEYQKLVEDNDNAPVDQKKTLEEINSLDKKIKEMKKAKNPISMKTQSTQVLEHLRDIEDFDKYWINGDSSITPEEKKKLRKLLPQLYQRLSEIVHCPEILCSDIHYPLQIEAQDVSNSKDLLTVLKEILETQNRQMDENRIEIFSSK
jgi:hypothetical protein